LQRAANVLREDAAQLRSLLELIASDRPHAATVVRSSYWHANGFAKLMLHRNVDPAFQLRLHVWNADGPPADEAKGGSNIHTHRWEFASVVAAGIITVEEFEEIDDPADAKALPCRKFAYDSPVDESVGRLRSTGACLLRPTGRAPYGPGDLHSGSLKTIHRVTPVSSSLTATVFVQGPPRVDSAFVYQERGHTASEDTGSTIGASVVMHLASATVAGMNRPEA